MPSCTAPKDIPCRARLTSKRYLLAVALCLLLGTGLRIVGLERGASDLGPGGAPAFHTFHPDEATLVRAALAPIDPFDPPFTAYGLLPVYVLRAALWTQGLDGADLGVVAERRWVYITARSLAALLSCAVLALTWGLGARFWGRGSALVGLVFVCCAPGAIQQGHFFIVDGFFTALALAGVGAIALALQTGERRWYIAAGLLVGALGAVRFNGLALGVVLALGHLLRPGAGGWRSLLAADLWWAGGAALAMVVGLQPYLLFNPALLARLDTHADFALSLRFARLELLQPWTLVDVHGMRYWDHWFGLWPWVVGWPLTLALIAGAVYAAWCGSLVQRLALLWCGLYFLSVGLLPVKAVRYVVPLLPLLALCSGALCQALWRRWRWPGIALAIFLAGHVAVSGLAFVRVYGEVDSRIQAGHWIAENVPKGAVVGLETGAFHLRGVVDPEASDHLALGVSGLFYGSPYMLCGQQVDYLKERLQQAEWLALAEENRAVQFGAVPELFPVVAAFYAKLLAGELGFEAVRRFVVEPGWTGVTFGDRGAEPSFLAYDHPTVRVFRRRGELDWTAWRAAMVAAPACADAGLRDVAALLARGEVAMALGQLRAMEKSHPHSALVPLLVTAAQWEGGDERAAALAYRRFLPAGAAGRMKYVRRSPFRHLVPGDAALACVDLGLEDLALRVLRQGLEEGVPADQAWALKMAESYLEVGRALMRRGQTAAMEEALQLSLAIHPHPVAHNVLATAAFERGDYAPAVAQWRASLALDGAQGDTHATLGQVLLARMDRAEEALAHLERALQLEPARAGELERWLAAARARLD